MKGFIGNAEILKNKQVCLELHPFSTHFLLCK